MAADFRPDSPRFAGATYAAGALSLLLINGGLLFELITGSANTVAAAIVVVNLGVFTIRALYAIRHQGTLFSEASYRVTDQATGAERVGFYVFVVVIVAGLVEQLDAAFGWGFDTSLGELGQAVMLLAVTAPTATYLAAGHGKLRRIVREQTQPSSVGPAASSAGLT